MKPQDALAAALAFIAATKGDVVPIETIIERSRICKACPLKVKTTGVSRVSQILGSLASKHNLPKEISDYSCSICGCNFQLLLPSIEGHKDNEKQKKRRIKGNPNCWILKL